MVTQYDVFEVVYKNKIPVKPIEVVRKLNKSEKEYNNIHRFLIELEKNNFLTKTKYGFQAKINSKIDLLYNLIYYCLSNNINYNLLLDKNLAKFISQSLIKKEITSKNVKINPRTFIKYIDILNKYDLLLIISKKPLKIKIFYNYLLKNLLLYFDFKPLIKEKTSLYYIDKIEKELKLYKRLRKKNEQGFKKIVDELEISFVHHSLTLEGNPITLPDTIRILKDKIIPKNLSTEDVDEVKNYQNAILQMLNDSSQKKPLTLQTILNYHNLAMQHNPKIAGKIRKVEVSIIGNPNFKVAKARDIESKLNQLLDKYNKFIKKKSNIKEIIDFTAFFHNEFQYIHPFVDGNSRTTRLITFYLLQSKDIPILDFPFGLLDEYLNYTKGYKHRDDKRLSENLQEIILFNLKRINDKL